MGSSASSCPHIVEGELAFDYPPAGKPLKTWYKVTGDITPTSIPLFILHGGPGAGAEAYNILSDLTVKYGIPIIQYDQVGCKRSTHLQEKKGAGPEFWKDTIFVLELHNLIRHFGLDNDGRQYDVIGHSWGGMFGTVFAGGRPKGLRRYIVWSAAPSLQLWNFAQKGLLKTMPEEIQDTIERCKREGTTDSQEYKDAINEIYKRFLCRIDPVPDDIMDGLNEIEKDSTVISSMSVRTFSMSVTNVTHLVCLLIAPARVGRLSTASQSSMSLCFLSMGGTIKHRTAACWHSFNVSRGRAGSSSRIRLIWRTMRSGSGLWR